MANRWTLFQDYLVTTSEDGSIPIDAKMVAEVKNVANLQARMLIIEAPRLAETLDEFVKAVQTESVQHVEKEQPSIYRAYKQAREALSRVGVIT